MLLSLTGLLSQALDFEGGSVYGAAVNTTIAGTSV